MFLAKSGWNKKKIEEDPKNIITAIYSSNWPSSFSEDQNVKC
jgi:hypothetical protein